MQWPFDNEDGTPTDTRLRLYIDKRDPVRSRVYINGAQTQDIYFYIDRKFRRLGIAQSKKAGRNIYDARTRKRNTATARFALNEHGLLKGRGITDTALVPIVFLYAQIEDEAIKALIREYGIADVHCPTGLHTLPAFTLGNGEWVDLPGADWPLKAAGQKTSPDIANDLTACFQKTLAGECGKMREVVGR